MARYRDLESTLPFSGRWRNPIAAVFTVKVCAHECATCGSSHKACTHLTWRRRPVLRRPASLGANVEAFARLPNEIVIELFSLPPPQCLREIDRCVPHWSIEFRPETHDQAVHNAQEGEADYTTEEMEEMLREALPLRCEHLFQLGDARLSCYILLTGPFLDPGSRGF